MSDEELEQLHHGVLAPHSMIMTSIVHVVCQLPFPIGVAEYGLPYHELSIRVNDCLRSAPKYQQTHEPN